jgi:transposase InsO family protein
LARKGEGQDPLYRAWKLLGERLQRELQWLRSSVRGALRDELLNGKIFYTLKEARVLIEQWRNHYNTIRSHSARLQAAGARRYLAPPR